MDSLRFDAWTRRRVNLAAAGRAALVIGATPPGPGTARKTRRKKKRCKKASQPCQKGKHARRCCKGLRCDELTGLGGYFCCRPTQTPCASAQECCVGLSCGAVTGLPPGPHCCGGSGVPCAEKTDCCFNNPCTGGFCED